MKKGEDIVLMIDGDIKGAQVIDMLPNGNVLTSLKDYYGEYMALPRRIAFTALEWEQIKGEYV